MNHRIALVDIEDTFAQHRMQIGCRLYDWWLVGLRDRVSLYLVARGGGKGEGIAISIKNYFSFCFFRIFWTLKWEKKESKWARVKITTALSNFSGYLEDYRYFHSAISTLCVCIFDVCCLYEVWWGFFLEVLLYYYAVCKIDNSVALCLWYSMKY